MDGQVARKNVTEADVCRSHCSHLLVRYRALSRATYFHFNKLSNYVGRTRKRIRNGYSCQDVVTDHNKLFGGCYRRSVMKLILIQEHILHDWIRTGSGIQHDIIIVSFNRILLSVSRHDLYCSPFHSCCLQKDSHILQLDEWRSK